MKIAQGDQIEWVRGLEYRGGIFHSRRLMEGTPGTIDNFQLSMGRNNKDFVSPRHRHNFEQFRFQFENELDFARDGKMAPGMIGYFPEGAHYGPQTSDMGEQDNATTFVLQFGGASGSGYLANAEVRRGMEELKKFGRFEEGVFRRNDDVPGKRNRDGYQAIWEHINGREMVYPKPRYPGPILMDSTRYDWVQVPGAPGVAEKLLGVFTERRTEAGFTKIAAGATFTGKGRGIYLATRGTGQVADQPLRKFTTVFLDWEETAAFTADTEVEMIHFGLPDLRDLNTLSGAFESAEAAE